MSSPVWIDYADALTPDVRDVFARPGVVVTSGGKTLPAYYRAHGAATTFFELQLPDLVGQPSAPADPASIEASAAKLMLRAVASTGCSTPQIALNELFGANLAAPWSAKNVIYRANVLALVKKLAAAGAYPVLLVHGDYTLAGATADWWRQVAGSGEIVDEAYYDASHISALGSVMGNRRMRLGMRKFVADFGAIGIAPQRLGVMLGFHSSKTPGVGGRQGLEPREQWLRVVKWEALAARQVAQETAIASIWSWGWAAFSGPDPDKAAAACVYLWARNSSLCEGPAVAGSAFRTSLVEGQLVLPAGVTCSFAGGHVPTAAVDALAALTHSHRSALSAVFARVALRSAAPVSFPQVLEVERQAIDRVFAGHRQRYVLALTRAHATLGVARAIIRDELRRRAIAAGLAAANSPQTMLASIADREAKAVSTAICLGDQLPGDGNFPVTDAREVGVVPLLHKLPFLFSDQTAPAAPASPNAASGNKNVVITWQPSSEPDLAGYQVYRSSTAGGPYTPVGPFLDRPILIDTNAPSGTPFHYAIRAVDTTGNFSAPSSEVSPSLA